jgi:toxin ParE1/3/4
MRLRWTQPAARDFTHICDYTRERDGPTAARRVALAIYEGVSSLTHFPQRGRPGRRLNTRELVLSGLPFVVVYRIREEVIEINRILHGAQQWP